MDTRPPSVLILANPREMADSHPIWGTGGWLPADERIALDWLTLCRLIGFEAESCPTNEFRADRVDTSVHWLVLACDPSSLGHDVIKEMRIAVETRPLLLICQATVKDHPLASWLGIHVTDDAVCGGLINASRFSRMLARPLTIPWLHTNDKARPAACLDESPIAAAMPVGNGRVLATSFNASELRDHDGVGTALLMHLISAYATVAHACLDWQGVLIPRMDDPGSSEAQYHDIYDHTCLGPGDWSSLASVLRDHDAKTSVGYVSGWVDAGEVAPGTLLIDGVKAERVAGKVHPSPRVKFESDRHGTVMTYDHVAEHQALLELRRQGLLEVELHGHTHIFPDRDAWLAAADRFSNKEWFREFGAAAANHLAEHPEIPHPIDEGLSAFREYFDRFTPTLICPGEVFTRQVLLKALDAGIMQVSSYYLAFRHRESLCWAQHVCAPYLDKPDPAWFSAGLPVVGCYHDFDIARHGVGWLSACLDGWRDAGCRRFMGLDDLNSLLQLRMILKETHHGWELHLHIDPVWPLPQNMEIQLHFAGRPVPSQLEWFINGEPSGLLRIAPSDDCSVALKLPPA